MGHQTHIDRFPIFPKVVFQGYFPGDLHLLQTDKLSLYTLQPPIQYLRACAICTQSHKLLAYFFLSCPQKPDLKVVLSIHCRL